MAQKDKENESGSKRESIISPLITGVFAIITTSISTIAIIYAANVTKTSNNIYATSTSVAATATQRIELTEQAPTVMNEVTREVEVTREIPVTRIVEITKEVTPFPTALILSPGQISINIDYDGRTTRDDFVFKVTTIDIIPNGRMRLNTYFWNQSNVDLYIRFTLENCAYISDRDNGTKYQVEASNVSNFTDTRSTTVQPQSRVDYWFEFEDAISNGAKHLTINLCPDTFGAYVSFTPFEIDLTP